MTHTTGHVIRMLSVGLGTAILAFGLCSEDWRSPPWATVTLLVFGLPLAMQLLRSPAWRVYALWFGAFVVAQSLLTPLLKGDHVALPPGLKTTVHVTGETIPGYPPGVRQVSTDERGWRVQPPVDYAAKTGVRIFAIGGSTTESIALDDRSTWTHRLQEALAAEFAGVQVVNTGASGLRARNHAATLQVVAGLQPDLALILLGGNDWNKHIKDQFEPDRDRWQPLPLRDTAMIQAIDAALLTPLRRMAGQPSWTQQSIRITKADDLVGNRNRATNRRPVHSWVPAAVSSSYAADLEKLGALCRRLRCMFVTQPTAYGPPEASERLKAQFWMSPPYAEYGLDAASMSAITRLYNDHLTSFARRHGHGLCDLAAAMTADENHFYDDMHFTDLGAQRVSQVVAQCARRALRAGAGAAKGS